MKRVVGSALVLWAVAACTGSPNRSVSDPAPPDGDEAGSGGGATIGTAGSTGGAGKAGGGGSGGAAGAGSAGTGGAGGTGGTGATGTPDAATGQGGTGANDAGVADSGRAADGPAMVRDTATGGDLGGVAANGFSVLTNRYDNFRTGANTSEKTLTVANVAADNGFGLLFSRLYDGNPYGQPLYVSGLNIKGKIRNVVFVATSTNNVYAFDADEKAESMPLWTRRVSAPGEIVTDAGTATGHVTCKDMYPFVGITTTPVIDVALGRIYLVAKEGKAGGTYVNKLHVLDLLTGDPIAGTPVALDASVPTPGGGTLKLDGWRHFVRAGLLLTEGTVYMAFTSHCDQAPYYGWVLGYDAVTMKQKFVYNTGAGAAGSGIWQSGIGLAANQNGIFFDTGNGPFSADGKSTGMSVVRLRADTTLADWFTPSNAAALNSGDLDLTAGVVLVPNTNQLISGGKESVLYLIDQMNMTHFNAGGDKIVQRLPVGVSAMGEIHNITFWNNRVYVWPDDFGLRVYSYANGKLGTTPVGTFEGRKASHPGGTVVISSNGTTAGTGVLWATLSGSGDPWHDIATGVLWALDAMNPSQVLWRSDTDFTRDGLGNLAKFSPPTVANGKVYVNTFAKSNLTSPSYLRVYGLLK